MTEHDLTDLKQRVARAILLDKAQYMTLPPSDVLDLIRTIERLQTNTHYHRCVDREATCA